MVVFSKSFRDFLREARAKGNAVARLLSNYHENYTGDNADQWDKFISDAEVNYITVRSNGLLSFLPAGKEHAVNDHGDWAREGRQEGKPAKVIRRLFTQRAIKQVTYHTQIAAAQKAHYAGLRLPMPENPIPSEWRHITDSSFEQFGNQYKAMFLDNGFVFKIQPRSNITNIYNMSRHEGGGPLNDSCMNGDDYMGIYERCKQVEIFTLESKDGLLCGRALLWTIEHSTYGEIKFMDRIYCAQDYMNDLFLAQASERGWWRKRVYTAQSNKNEWINPATDGMEKIAVTITTTTEGFDNYPYIDTFCYGDDGHISNIDDNDRFVYQETGGGREDRHSDDDESSGTYDEINDENIPDDESVYLCEHGERRFRNRTTHQNNSVCADMGNNREEWFHEDDENVVRLRVGGSYSHYFTGGPDIIVRADGDHDHIDNVVMCETDNEYYRSNGDELIMSQGAYYHKEDDDNVVYCKSDCEYYYLPDNNEIVVKATDDEWYLTTDDAVTQVNGEGTWFVIRDDSPKMIIQINGKWYNRCDVADVVTYSCNADGKKVETIVHYPQKSKLIKFVECRQKGNNFTLGWYLKADLIKWRNRYYHPDDRRLLVRVVKTMTTRKAQTA